MIDLENLYDLTQKDSDRTLYLAIILQALLDLTKPTEKDDSIKLLLKGIKQVHGYLHLLV